MDFGEERGGGLWSSLSAQWVKDPALSLQ